jgi:hypothetical protein
MTLSRRTALALSAAAVIAAPALGAARPGEADSALATAYERWRWLDREVDAAAAIEDEIITRVEKRAREIFGHPRDDNRQRKFLAYLQEHQEAAGISHIQTRMYECEDAARGALAEIIATSADGSKGMLIKAELLKLEFDLGLSDFGPALIESLIADLTQIGGGAS